MGIVQGQQKVNDGSGKTIDQVSLYVMPVLITTLFTKRVSNRL
jgi:hypothetical protein